MIDIPDNISEVLSRLNKAGYQAYIVGGCVRDALMGVTPHDFDVTTSATPQQVESVFEGYQIIETGIKHGTVTVLSEGEPVEITTFRVDGEYLDGRHPESVTYATELSDDISRRDFTINGIAYNPESGLADNFGGREDINNRLIRCIGDPDKRFNEDALRILRAMRFACTLGFEIEENTANSMLKNRGLLKKVSAERIFTEFKKMLCERCAADNIKRIFMQFRDIVAEMIPEIRALFDYPQHSRYHIFDAYEHSVTAAAAAAKICEGDPVLPLAMLLHDIAKPAMMSCDEDGTRHFIGHPEAGASMADEILRRLKSDNITRERVCAIIRYHDMQLSDSDKSLRRGLAKHGEKGFADIIKAHLADDSAKIPECAERIPTYQCMLERIREIAGECCYSVKSLAITGSDLKEIVPPSPQMGKLLDRLLSEVVDGELPNTREALLKRARELAEREN